MSKTSPIKIYSDGADIASILENAKDPRISGFTTNPTLMRKSGISDYTAFAKEVLTHIKHHPISFEVFADDFREMDRQARLIASWGKNVYVKIPITNTLGESALPLIRNLSVEGRVQLNVTALCTLSQVAGVAEALKGGAPAVVSVFAGRIADTGRDPMPIIQASRALCDAAGLDAEVLWASTRELINIKQAESAGAQIITVPPDLLKKLNLFGKDLGEYSLDTVKMFAADATAAGFTL